MSKDYKARVRSSLMNFLDKEAKQRDREGKPTRRNKTPEKDLQSEILKDCKKHGFELYITDNSAKWDNDAGRYVISTDFESGMSDLTGDREGKPCYIELKAPGQRATLRDHQRAFLTRKIDRGCFAIAADSWGMILRVFAGWQMENFSKHFLKNHLPSKRKQKKSQKPQGELPF